MQLEDIKALAAQGETHTIKFKSSTTQRKPAFETVCAFLNNSGGTVLIGVKNDGKIVGQEITDKIKQELAGELSKIEPPASDHVTIHYIPVDKNKEVIAIVVNRGGHAPYIYSGRPYERNQNTTERMKQHRYEQLLMNRAQFNHSWEEYIANSYTLEDLDHDEIYKAVTDGVTERRIPGTAIKDDVNEILHRLDLVEGDKLKNAAVVLFAKQDKMKLVQCMIKMARFKGTNKLGSFIDNQRFFGNAFDMLTTAEHFLIRHLPISSHFIEGQFKRVDKSALPVFAVREALINALCHREYRERSGCIELAIYDDRLEIWSRGLLPDGLNVDSLKSTHKSDPRNELISNVFYVRGLIEAWGTGTNRMIENCQDEGVPEPVFEEDCGGFSVIFKFNTPIGGEVDLSSFEPHVSDRQKAILNLFRDFRRLSANEIHGRLKSPPSLRTIKGDLSELKKAGMVEQLGKGRKSKWAIIKK